MDSFEEGQQIAAQRIEHLQGDYAYYGYSSFEEALRAEGLRAHNEIEHGDFRDDPERLERLRGFRSRLD